MPIHSRRRLAAVLSIAGLTVATTAGLAACSGSSDGSTTSSTATNASGGSNKVIAPVMIDVATVGGTVVQARTGQMVVIKVDNPSKWTATVADPSVATFVAGREEANVTFNPGLSDLQPGTTAVTLTNGTTTVSFTLEVVKAG